MKYILFFVCSNLIFASFGQSTSPEVLSTAGDHYDNGSIQLSWTLGEPVIQTISDGSNVLTQGFHQTNLSWASTFELDETITFNVYPNPVVNQLSVEVSVLELGSTIQLIDSRGRIIFEKVINDLTTIIDFSSLSMGSYHLNLQSINQNLLKTFTIQKAN